MGSRKEITIRVPPSLLAKFEAIYPQHGAKQWFFETCMENLVKMHAAGKVETYEEVIERTIKETTRDLSGP